MTSGKQRKKELAAARARRKVLERNAKRAGKEPPPGSVPVNRELLAPNNSYGAPAFVVNGYYVDTPFTCVDCGAAQVWTATQQKWWYEVAKGFAYSIAKRCGACRRKIRAAKDENAVRTAEGLRRKAQRTGGT